MPAKPTTIDEYLAPLSSDKRAALQKLRKAIKAAAPKAEECISYQIPAFRLDGKMLVWFHAAANHCSFFPGRFTDRRAQEGARGLQDEQGYDPICGGPSPARHARAQARQGAHRRARRQQSLGLDGVSSGSQSCLTSRST